MKHTHTNCLKALALLLGASSFALTSCSSDDDSPKADPGSQIRFNVTVPKSLARETTTASINQFSLYSFVNGAAYMSDVTVSRNDGSNWTAQPVMYWPSDGSAVNFYCINPAVGSQSVAQGTSVPHINGFNNASGTTDLLYAVTSGATVNPVRINFRHALSRLSFNFRRRPASESQAPLRVVVKEVTVNSVYGTASFTYPMQTTAPDNEVRGMWSAISNPSEVSIYAGQQAVLTDDYVRLNTSGYEFAIPQTLIASAEDLSGAYIKVKCTIYDENSNVQIWPKGQADDYLYFPIASPGATNTKGLWEEGKAYAYNITIGVPSDFGKIEFDVTVDEYPKFENLPTE